mmetsp:Transcript_1762/g.2454  ORF Transcript_1762/g.2454 Transcript_1762/m.2454 type:complete len:551 (-) Transcript_1762:14-1666(-)
MSRMELSFSRRDDHKSPLREALADNSHIMMEEEKIIPKNHHQGFIEMSSLPPAEETDVRSSTPANHKTAIVDTEQEYETTSTVEEQRVGLCHELFTYFINRSRTKKLVSFLIITSLILVLIEYILYNNVHISTFTSNFLDWITLYTDIAILSYIVMMSLLTLFFVPPSLFVFASGFIFQDVYGKSGIMVAWTSSFIGTLIGGSLGFWRARYLSRDLVEILLRRYPILRAVDVAIVKNSLRVMMLMRLNPLIPFGVLNYIFGISGVDMVTFMLAMPAVLPWYLFLVCLGAVSSGMRYVGGEGNGNLLEDHVFGVILISTGIASGIIGLVITWRFAKKELQKDAEMERWRMKDPMMEEEEKEELPDVIMGRTRTRSSLAVHPPSPSLSSSSVVVAATSLDDNIDDGADEENPSSYYHDPSFLVTHEMQQATTDEYNDNYNSNITTDDTIGNSTSSDSKLGEKVKQVVRKLKKINNSKSSEEDSKHQAQASAASLPANSSTTNITIEDRDLGFTDYFRTQVLGEDGFNDNSNAMQHNYRNNLDWPEIILDDFS